jgi:UMF1 family MFS transporter
MTTSRTKQQKRATFAWALWDWAEQPFPTIMQTFIFPLFLAAAAGAVSASCTNPDVKSSFDTQLGLTTSISGIALALIAPVLGRRSDQHGRRKFWLLVNSMILVAIMVASFFLEPKPEFVLAGLVLYGLGSVVQESAFINYYAMLKQVTTEKNIGRVSGYAWGLGYVGGIILLLIALVGFIKTDHPWFGVATTDGYPIRAVFLFAAVWMLVFTIPMILFVPEIPAKAGIAKESVLGSYKSIWLQLKTLRQQAPETLKFLISSAIFRDGLAGVFTFGAVLGSLAFCFETSDIIIFGIAANLVSGLGAAIGGRLDDKFGSRSIIVASLAGLIVAGSGVFFFASAGKITYWIGGLFLCLFVGPAQASARTFVARFTPKGREGEVFGLYQFTGRAVSFLSGSMWALAILFAQTVLHVANATIWGIWGLMIILAVGLALLLRVDPNPKVLNDLEEELSL